MTCTALDCTPFDGRTRNRFLEVEFGPNNTTLYRSLAGTTTGDAQSLVPLARSWNFPPPLELSENARAAGWQNKGYDKYQRAYILRNSATPTGSAASAAAVPLKSVEFTIHATAQSPLHNVCVVLENFDGDVSFNWNASPSVFVNGTSFPTNKGVIRDLTETKTLLFLNLRSEKSVKIEIK